MIYRLRYCNKDGVEARVDIQKGSATPIIEIEGTERPFILSYNNDKGDKSGMFLSSSADIEIYETTDFNINNLKTSNETELSVTHYINNVISWQGFIIPDFFSIEVRNNPVITMTASDRLGTLKSVTLSDLPSMVSLRELAISCLNKTGLELPLSTMADFNNGTGINDFFNSKILTQRLSDTKGRSISCYDILSSILTASNSFLVQRLGGWHIINKIQHEAGSGKLYTGATSFINWSDVIFNFSDISVGGRRTIIPVASSVGVFHEFGGGRLHPENYDFSKGAQGWIGENGFTVDVSENEIKSYTRENNVWNVDYGDTDKNRLKITNFRSSQFINLDLVSYAQNTFPIITTNKNSVGIEIDLSVLGMPFQEAGFVVLAHKENSKLAFNPSSGAFETYDPQAYGVMGIPKYLIRLEIPVADYSQDKTTYEASTKSVLYNSTLEADDLTGYSISIRVYGTGSYNGRVIPMFVNFANVRFKNTQELPKGNIYKTEKGDNYTKAHDIETTIFADYLTTGLNGYFYDYSIDDTSSLYNSNNELTSKWTAYNDPEQLPLLQHITRQRSRLFSVAHDLLSAEIEVNNFDPLAIFVACGVRHTVVSAQFDFFKSSLSVELEEVAFQNATVRDFIYSYFGDGESGIKSIGGISGGGGGGGTGGGLTSEQIEILSFWKKDPDNPDTIFTEMNAYSTKELSAYGLGSGSGGGGGGTTVSWGTELNGGVGLTVDGIIKTLALKSGLDLKQDKLIAGTGITIIGNIISSTDSGGGSGSTVIWGTELNGGIGLTVDGISKTLALHSALTDKQDKLTAGTGITIIGNIISSTATGGVTSIGLTAPTGFSVSNSPITSNGNLALSFATGYSLPTTAKQGQWDTAYSERHTHSNKSVLDGITSTLITNWNSAFTNTHTHSNKSIIDQLTQDNINVLKKMSMDGLNIKVNTNLWSVGEVSAYGLGSGSGGGGGGSLVSWGTESNSFIPLTVEGISKTVALQGHTHSKSEVGLGNVLNVASYSKIESDERFALLAGFNSHVNDNIRHITGAERTKWDGVVTDFAGLEIGGRNLARNFATWELLNATRVLSNNNNTVILSPVSAALCATMSPNIRRIGNYIVSVNVKTSGPTRIFIDGRGTVLKTSHESLRNNIHFTLPSGFDERIVMYYNATVEVNNNWYIGIESDSVTKSVELSYPQLKKGNKATDWTPAPEDQVSDWLTTDVNSFSFIKNKPTQLSQFTDNLGVATHIANTSNPHSVTKAQVGLGNVDNTSDLLKPISTAVQTALNLKANLASPTFTGSISILNPATTTPCVINLNSNYQSEIWSGKIITDYYGRRHHDSVNQGMSFIGGRASHEHFRWFKADYTETMTLFASGNLALGKGTNPTDTAYKLDVSGTGRFTGNVTAPTFIGNLQGNATSATDLSRSIIAGNGLSGGGVLNADRTITLGTPSNINATTTNSVSASSHTHALTSSTVDFTSLAGLSNTLNGMVSGSVGSPISGPVVGFWTTLASNTNYGAGFFTRLGRAFTLGKENGVIGEWQELAYLTSIVDGAKTLQSPNWKIEQSGSELVFKYNNVVKARLLANGSFVAVGEVTAYE